MDEIAAPATNLLVLTWNGDSWTVDLAISIWLAILIVAVCVAFWLLRFRNGISLSKFEIDQAEIGVGSSKFSFRPNLTDRQVGYAIWVELSTRKIGLPIDLEHDVISEIYSSWYEFFSVTRELIKDIPVSKVKQKSTQAIIKLSIEVLNEGLRPHLTRWQARFRQWYERETKRYEASSGIEVIDPQKIQSQFPMYEALSQDMLKVNQSLIKYRNKMRQLVIKD